MTTQSRRRGVVAAALAAALGIVAVSGGTALAADQAVDIAGFAFSPGTVTVAVGDTVTWANADAQGHTATADDGSWDTGTIAGNGSKAVTFTTSGTFAYHCSIHPAMTATLVVKGAASNATTPPTDVAATVPASAGDDLRSIVVLVLAALLGLAFSRRFERRADGARVRPR